MKRRECIYLPRDSLATAWGSNPIRRAAGAYRVRTICRTWKRAFFGRRKQSDQGPMQVGLPREVPSDACCKVCERRCAKFLRRTFNYCPWDWGWGRARTRVRNAALLSSNYWYGGIPDYYGGAGRCAATSPIIIVPKRRVLRPAVIASSRSTHRLGRRSPTTLEK
jgi:hypothetical protein